MLNDHYPRIHAQQQQTIENAVMEDMEKRAAPLMWAVIAAIAASLLISLASHADTFMRHYDDLAAVNDAMAQCMNGQPISLGDAVLNCKVQEYKLVSGLAQGGQP